MRGFNPFTLIVFLAAIIYIVYQGSFLFLAPKIILIKPPKNPYVSDSQELLIKGRVVRTIYLRANNENIFFNDKGYFEKKTNLLSGENNIEFAASGKFATTTLQLKIIYNK